MDFEKLCAERYSLRKYADRPVEAEKLEKVLEAGHNAPTAHNLQPQRILRDCRAERHWRKQRSARMQVPCTGDPCCRV